MIQCLQYKISRTAAESYALILQCGSEIARWEIVHADERAGVIEWKQVLFSFLTVAKIRVYIKEPRPQNVLVTIYVNRPLLLFDPLGMCTGVFNKLKVKLDHQLSEKHGGK